MAELAGWLLDLYEDAADGLTLWLLADDGRRLRLAQPFPVTFYAAGPPADLRRLWRWLESQPEAPKLSRMERRDLFLPQPQTVLAVECASPHQQAALFRHTLRAFPDLTYYDADIPTALRHAARHGTFPLARLRLEVDAGQIVRGLQTEDTPWLLDPPPAPLRSITLRPECDPAHANPQAVLLQSGGSTWRLDFDAPRPLLINLQALLLRLDPDLVLTDWGDTWLLPRLLRLAGKAGLALPLSRDPRRSVGRRPERTYFSYGQIIYRGAQILLYGRWHIDRHNAALWDDYTLAGVLEAARVTRLPVQNSARTSPGTGISSMQIVTALEHDILVPWRKQQVEAEKSALDLLHNDQGGMVYQPLVGLHANVGGVDFVSMYPSLMVRHNISPETMRPGSMTPETDEPGLVPMTLAPLLEKRIALKQRVNETPAWHPRHGADKARSSAHKWLLVTCFGYLGYKNARFGRIEAHEAVTSGGREALLQAKEAAEEQGFTIIHMYVDGLWIVRPDAVEPGDFAPLLNEIAARTGLSISLDGVYRWVAFLPSRVDERISVANRYFGVFEDGSLKVRGIECRRRDTPGFIADVQMELLECLAEAKRAADLPAQVPKAMRILRRRLAELRAGQVAPARLLVGQRLTRKPEEYRAPSAGARAALQLIAAGRQAVPGQRIRFVWLRGMPDVHAWDLPEPVPARRIDLARYRVLLLRAAATVFQPLGFSAEQVEAMVENRPTAVPLPPVKLLHQGKNFYHEGAEVTEITEGVLKSF